MERSESIAELAGALAMAQARIVPAAKDATNPHYRRRYADLASIWEVARGPLNEHGLSIVQAPETSDSGGMRLRTMVLHASGEFLSSSIDLAYDPSSMQSLGSAITYARRYALAAMVGIVAEEDDDGHLAATRPASAPASAPDRNGQATMPENHTVPSPPPAPSPRTYAPSGGGKGDHPPRTGSALYRWLKDQEEVYGVGLVRYIDHWAKLQEFPKLMKEWNGDQIAGAHAEAVRKLQSIASAA